MRGGFGRGSKRGSDMRHGSRDGETSLATGNGRRRALLATLAVSLVLGSCASADVMSVGSITPYAPTEQRVTPAAPRTPAKFSRGEGAPSPSFRAFVSALWPEAQARGVSRSVYDAAFSGVTQDEKIIALTKKQAEFVKPVWEYLASAVSQNRLERGTPMTRQWASTLDTIERTYGVDRKVVMGVWGMETNFGGFTGSHYVVRALATLAEAKYRGDYFRNELLTALVILQQGHVSPDRMEGSWAGAMGQTQFMPSSFMRYAVDFTGDGRRDIWTSVPDALASTANYLKQHGWQPGLPWGFEVKVPSGFRYGRDKKSLAAWASEGVRRVDGRPLSGAGEARLFLPAGARGPVFLVTANFDVIKRYNNSDAYALGVAHLGDRLYGGAPIQTPWPTDQAPLAKHEREEVQRHLASRGYDIGDVDGRIGSQTRDAIFAFQESRGLIADGHADNRLLAQLRQTR